MGRGLRLIFGEQIKRKIDFSGRHHARQACFKEIYDRIEDFESFCLIIVFGKEQLIGRRAEIRTLVCPFAYSAGSEHYPAQP